MTIRKGDPWGEEVPQPNGLPCFSTARAIGRAVESHAQQPVKTPFACVTTDRHVLQLLGLEDHKRDTCLRIPVDIVAVDLTTAEGRSNVVALDTIEVGDGFFHGDWVLFTNTGYWRGKRIASRAHPNDGRVDLVTVNHAMSIRQRFLARYRMRWGTHLPHPHIAIKQVDSYSWDGPPRQVCVDGERIQAVTAIRIRVIPDAVTLYV